MSASSPEHDEEPNNSAVTRLLLEQVPHLAELPVRGSADSGSSNWVFRLGDRLAVRLPRSAGYAADLRNETRFLPHLAGSLTAPIPELVFAGRPGAGFPRPWAIVSWLPGDLPRALDASQQAALARTLGPFLQSLHAVDASGMPSGAEHWGYRCGEPVTDEIDGWADHAAARLADLFDPPAVLAAWQRLRDVPTATSPPCWVHTDLSAENLLVHPDGSLAGVIDFGGIGVGDRSVDLLYAWSLFDTPARELLREAVGVDAATWMRARAWAFVGPGLLTIAGYRHTMPTRTAQLVTMIERIAAEVDVRLP